MPTFTAPKWLGYTLIILAVAIGFLGHSSIVPDAYHRWLVDAAGLVSLLGVMFQVKLPPMVATPVVVAAKKQPPEPPVPPTAAGILLLIGMSALLSGCACWTATDPAYNSSKCVLARQAVDCGEQVGIGFATQLLSGGFGAVNSEAALSALEGQGGTAAGCILSAVTSLASSPAKPTAPVMGQSLPPLSASAAAHLASWKHTNGFDGVEVCVKLSGTKVCR